MAISSTKYRKTPYPEIVTAIVHWHIQTIVHGNCKWESVFLGKDGQINVYDFYVNYDQCEKNDTNSECYCEITNLISFFVQTFLNVLNNKGPVIY